MRKIKGKGKTVFKDQTFYFDMSKTADVMRYNALEVMTSALASEQNTLTFLKIGQALMAGHQIEIKPIPPKPVAAVDEKDLGEPTEEETDTDKGLGASRDPSSTVMV